jgi:hypothetical protein
MRKIVNSDLLIKKWEPTGLLRHADNPKIMAYCLEYTVNTTLETGVNERSSIIIPIVFKVINKIKPITRRESRVIVKDVMDRFPNFMLNNYNVIDDLMSITGVDWEAEMCRLFVEEYLKIYENNKSIR